VKNKEDEEPKEYFERNMLFVITLTIISLGIDFLAVYTLKNESMGNLNWRSRRCINATNAMVTGKSLCDCL
jgi:hypothetical protein